MRVNGDVLGLRLLMGAALVAVVALLTALPLIALHVDAQSAPYEIEVARSQLGQAIRRLALRTEEGAIDDVVFQHADPQVDQAWFQKNMTSPRVADVESQIVFTLDARDDVAFARDRGIPVVGVRKAAFEKALAPVVSSLRRRELGSERLRRNPQPGYTLPIIAGASTIIVQGRVYDVQALLISSKSGTIAQLGARAPVLLLITDIVQCLLPALRDHLRLRDVALIQQLPTPDQSSIALVDFNGAAVAYIAWKPRQPGFELLKELLSPILLVVGLLLASLFFAYRRGTRSAAALSASEAKSYHLAYYDQLTELGNRRLLNERLATLLSQSATENMSFAVLLIDLDRFKFVNDTFGHQCGDELIQETAQRLSATVGPCDFCARFGGDEFVILSAETASDEVAQLALRVLAELRKPFALTKAIIDTTGSIGIAVHLRGVAEAGELVRKADLALYWVKDRGRDNFCFYDEAMDLVLQNRRNLETSPRMMPQKTY